MVEDNKILINMDEHISHLERLKEWFDEIYNDPEFATLINKPRISTLKSGADYLLVNMRRLRADYVGRLKSKEQGAHE